LSKFSPKKIFSAVAIFAQAIAISIFSVVPAVAAPAISLPSSFAATTSFSAVNGAGSLAISGYLTQTVQANISTTSGNIKITTTTGLTAPTGYSSADWTSGTSDSFAFTGTETNVNNALNSLQFKAAAVGNTGTITVATFVAGAAYDSSSSHFYEAINNSSVINWELARCKAKYSNSDISVSAGTSLLNTDRCTSSTTLTRRTLGGLRGYLANITSESEQSFIKGKLNTYGWIGGADTDSEGTFLWMDGPEKGQVFWNSGTTNRRTTNTTTGSVSLTGISYGTNRFNYWSDGEPNDAGSNEDFVEFGFGSNGTIGSSWNDCQNGCNRTYYVVEYGDTGDTLSGASGSIAFTTKPILSVSPAITGTTRYGQILTSSTGTWTNNPTSYSYQWNRSAYSAGSYTPISGATSSTYTLVGADVGQYLKVTVTAINGAGSTTDTSTASTVITTVAIRISLTNQTTTYTGSASSFSNTYSISSGALVASDTFTSLTYTYSATSPSYNSTTPPTNAGSYTITPSAANFSVGSPSSYSISYDTATLTVSKANQTITFSTLGTTSTKAYPYSQKLAMATTGSSGTGTITYAVTSNGGTCATGGTCSLGDTGPGGGTIFYVSGSTYYEAAPKNWYSTVTYNGSTYDNSNLTYCTVHNPPLDTTSTGWGGGETNTAAFKPYCTSGIFSVLSAYRGGSKSDWYIPNATEMNGLANYWIARSAVSTQFAASVSAFYWTSDASWNSTYYWLLTQPYFSAGGVWTTAGAAYTHQGGKIIPIRRFVAGSDGASASGCALSNSSESATITSSTIGTCFIVASIAADANYNSASSSALTFTFTKARQSELKIGQYDAFVGTSTYPINVYGGVSSGALTRSLTDSGTAQCVLTNSMYLTASRVGTCSVQAVKEGDANYFAETATATIYWIQWSDAYATKVPSTPTEIVLNHETQIIRYSYETLTATSFANSSGNAITSASVGQVIRLIGTGFVSTDDQTTINLANGETVEFANLTINATDPMANYIQFTIPSGVTTDVVGVSSRKGTIYTTALLTITP
jgi:hypothetical protein